jgi:hypothetical protein
LYSDHEIEHLTEPWLEMVVLDQLCQELDDNSVYYLPHELERASSPASSMETPAPAEEARADAVAEDAPEADALEADAPASADSESEAEAEADADTVRPRAAAAWALRHWPSGGRAPPSEAERDALYTRAPASADSESEVVADADTVRPRAAAAWAAGLWPSGGAPSRAGDPRRRRAAQRGRPRGLPAHARLPGAARGAALALSTAYGNSGAGGPSAPDGRYPQFHA